MNIHVEDFENVYEFVEHFQLHKENYGDNFITFLEKHYSDLKESQKKSSSFTYKS